jgi:hypothetical protein
MRALAALHLFLSATPPASSLNSSDPTLYFLVPGLLILYYLAARYWINAHADPGAIVTQYTPPQNLSPGALRYSLTGSFDPKAIAATVLHLAARGLVTFQGLDEYYTILRTSEPLPPDLPREELAVYNTMFNLDKGGTAPLPGRLRTYEELPKDAFLLPPADGPVLLQLSKAIYDALPAKDRDLYFTDHLAFSIFGSFVSLYFLLLHLNDSAMRWAIFVPLFAGIVSLLVFRRRPDFRPSSDPRYAGNTVLLFLLVVIAITFGAIIAPDSLAFQCALPTVLILNLAMPVLLREPTYEGRRLLDEIDGYREFLFTVEIDRMQRLKSPGWKPSQATANLAYAIALDLGDAWEEFLENADFRSVIYERGPNGSFPKKHIVRTAPENAWVDHWSGWVAFAVAMLVLVIIETLAMRFVLPR